MSVLRHRLAHTRRHFWGHVSQSTWNIPGRKILEFGNAHHPKINQLEPTT